MEKGKERRMTVGFGQEPSKMQKRLERYVFCLLNAAVTEEEEKAHE